MPRTIRRCALSTVLLCLFLLSMTCHHVHAQPALDERPQDATVRQGDNVTFVCDLRNTNGYNIYWFYRHGQTNRYLSRGREIGVVSALSPGLASRLSVIGDESQEEFTLRIAKVQEADTGTYECQYAPPVVGATVTTAGRAQLTVLVPPTPQSPWCNVSSALGTGGPFAVGDSVYFYCNTYGGSPAPEITYYRQDERLTSVAQSIAHVYNLKAEDNGVTFTCTMTTPALDEPRNCSVMPLQILTNVTIEPTVSRAEEGSLASFECYGEGVPSIASYRWEVKNTDTGLFLSSEKYIILNKGRSLGIVAVGNLELVCIVGVPSGLTGNATARLEVVVPEWTTPLKTLPTESGPNSTETPLVSSATTIAAVVAPLVVLIASAVTGVLLWRRKQHRKGVCAGKGPNMTQTGPNYDEIKASEKEQNVSQERRVYAYAAVHEDGKSAPVDDKYEHVSLDGVNKIKGHAQDGPIVSEYLEMRDSSGYEVPSKSVHVYATVND